LNAIKYSDDILDLIVLTLLQQRKFDKTQWKSGFITKKDVLLGVKPPTTVCTSPG
jgi:hypothetical protein